MLKESALSGNQYLDTNQIKTQIKPVNAHLEIVTAGQVLSNGTTVEITYLRPLTTGLIYSSSNPTFDPGIPPEAIADAQRRSQDKTSAVNRNEQTTVYERGKDKKNFSTAFNTQATAVLEPIIDRLFDSLYPADGTPVPEPADNDADSLLDVTLELGIGQQTTDTYRRLVQTCWPHARDHFYSVIPAPPKSEKADQTQMPDFSHVQGQHSKNLLKIMYGWENGDSTDETNVLDIFDKESYIENAPLGKPDAAPALPQSDKVNVEKIYAFLQLTPKNQDADPFSKAIWQNASRITPNVLVCMFMKHAGVDIDTCVRLTGLKKRDIEATQSRFAHETGLTALPIHERKKVIERMFGAVIPFSQQKETTVTINYTDSEEMHADSQTTPITELLTHMVENNGKTPGSKAPEQISRKINFVKEPHRFIHEYNIRLNTLFAGEPLLASLLQIPINEDGIDTSRLARSLPEKSHPKIAEIYQAITIMLHTHIRQANTLSAQEPGAARTLIFASTETPVPEAVYSLATVLLLGGLKKELKPDKNVDLWKEKIAKPTDPRDLAILALFSGSETFNTRQMAYMTGMTVNEVDNTCARLKQLFGVRSIEDVSYIASRLFNPVYT